MHSKAKLAEALRGAGLLDMAAKAETGYYHDFESPLDTPSLQLASDLTVYATDPGSLKHAEARALLDRHLAGEFDATADESEAWAASAEGKQSFAALVPDPAGKDAQPPSHAQAPAAPATDLTFPLARLALREEGDFWVAYLAPTEGMKGAVVLATIQMRAVIDPRHKLTFMALTRDVMADIIEANTGYRPIWPAPGGQPAPEHERTRRA